MFDTIVRFIILALLAIWCFILVRPFIALILWGAVIAVVLYPAFLWLSRRLGNRQTLSAILLTLLGIAIILGPVSFIVSAIVSSIHALAASISDSSLQIPPPPPAISKWPLFGGALSDIWQQASNNLLLALEEYRNQLQALTTKLLALAGSAGLGILQFLLSTVIAAGLMLNANAIGAGLRRFILRLDPDRGEEFIFLAVTTVRNVTRGVIGIALFQTFLISIGLMLAGIPLAGILIVLCLILSIVQIGPGLVVLPAIVYAWISMGAIEALLFTLWMVVATASDNVLKPLLMARGLPVPMLVIFIGVIGGTLAHGIIGLFVGPVILALGYELLGAWVDRGVNLQAE
ncbi:MAG: AI-2E family transporter [Synechococcus sp.]